MRRRRRLGALALAVGLLGIPGVTRAQRVEVAGGAFNAQRRVYDPGGTLQQTGLMLGGRAALLLGRVRIGVDGWMGTLKGDGTAANPDVKARTTSASLQVQALSNVQLGLQYEVRRFEADVGVTVWSMLGATVRAEPGLGVPGLQGLVDVSLLPASSVQGGPKLTMAIETGVGIMYAPRSSPLSFRLRYRFERYDIASIGGAGARYEQFRGLVGEVGLSFGR